MCTECGGPSSLSPPIVPNGVTLAALARDEGDGSSRGSNDESEVSGSNLAEEMTVVRARENLYKQSGKMGLNGKLSFYTYRDIDALLKTMDLVMMVMVMVMEMGDDN